MKRNTMLTLTALPLMSQAASHAAESKSARATYDQPVISLGILPTALAVAGSKLTSTRPTGSSTAARISRFTK